VSKKSIRELEILGFDIDLSYEQDRMEIENRGWQ
jgi:hypothetical protein